MLLIKIRELALLLLALTLANISLANAQQVTQQLRDPTRPGVGAVVVQNTQKKEQLVLNSVLLSGNKATAIFNNKMFTVGDRVQGVKIVRINNEGVLLADGRQFSLYQAVTETKGR